MTLPTVGRLVYTVSSQERRAQKSLTCVSYGRQSASRFLRPCTYPLCQTFQSFSNETLRIDDRLLETQQRDVDLGNHEGALNSVRGLRRRIEL